MIIHRKKKRRLVLILLLLFFLYLLSNTVSICIYSTKDEACPADVIIVLGAATSDQEVSPVYRERLNHAIDLYQQGYAEAIIVTGGRAKGSESSDAYAAKQYLISQNIPEEAVLTEEISVITQENLTYSKVLMEEAGWQTAILVSDPLHMKRAMLLAKDTGILSFSSPTPTTMYRSLKTKIPFLARELFYYTGYQWYRLFPFSS